MVIVGILFPYNRIHKATWVSSYHTTGNQIDHIYITKKFRSMEHVRTRRGANIAPDHHLLDAR